MTRTKAASALLLALLAGGATAWFALPREAPAPEEPRPSTARGAAPRAPEGGPSPVPVPAPASPTPADPRPVGEFRAREVPESLPHRALPFLAAVEEANALPTLDDEQRLLAEKAWTETLAHAARVETDPAYRALDGALAIAARDPVTHGRHLRVRFASPYLLCYVSKEALDEYQLLSIASPEARAARREAILPSRARAEALLADRARLMRAVYDEFLRRWAEPCDLKDLASPYGGRPDYPPGVRSYADGYPLVAWILEPDAWRAWRTERGEVFDERSVLDTRTGRLSLLAADPEDDEDALAATEETAGLAVAQLLGAFRSQRDEWADPRVAPTFFEAGFSRTLGTVERDADGGFGFPEERIPSSVRSAAEFRRALERSGKALPRFSLESLVGLEGWAAVREASAMRLHVHPDIGAAVFGMQAAGFVRFLERSPSAERREAWSRFVAAMLNPDPRVEGYAAASFRREFGVVGEAAWKALDEEFAVYWRDLLARAGK